MIRSLAIALALFVANASATSPLASELPQTSNTRKAKMMAKLMDSARATENFELSRNLEQGALDLTGYEIKFEKCQFVKSYDDELAEDESASTVLTTRRFAVFRLCPSGSCNKCNSNYGEYVLDLETYVEIATEYYLQDRDDMCTACNNICNAGDDAVKDLGLVDCDSCGNYCSSIENLQNNGYVESYEFAQCMQVFDNGAYQVFAGAMCSDNGKSIKIGAFKDEDCSKKMDGNIKDYMQNGQMLDNDILQKTSSSNSCVSCVATNYESAEDSGEANEMCGNLYDVSAKCESKHGFDNYWKDNDDFSNQYIQEDLVCDFISSLKNGNYDQYGEIVLTGLKRSGTGGATAGQKFLVGAFFLGSCALAFYSSQIHAQLTKSTKADLSAQGGAMA